METANITYQDDGGSVKVKIDYEKCIACGRCISACKHDARYYSDDTEQFFEDLRNGAQISVIVAPSIRTNIPNYKKLFTYLKKLGVNKIFDVSLGADICIWAYIRYIESKKFVPIITQPCPVIVNYCQIYHHDLLPKLSPVQSPMACTSIYLKNYQGINDRIAALSPCTAKKNEFEETNLAQYNITFAKLLEYMNKNNITLPDEKTEFENDECGFGSLFPMPGGLKENIEYYTGKKFHIAKAEGFHVYDKLDKYANTPDDFLPDIFDVLSCREGCNIGSACSHEGNVFEIEKRMSKKRRRAVMLHEKDYYKTLYKTYDNTFDLSHFIREYHPVSTSSQTITDSDINMAFKLLGKTDYEKQNIDCGACGSETCHNMARKIALNVNIPINCIVKSAEDAKAEHEKNLLTNEKLTNIEHMREADVRMRVMLDAAPIGTYFWDNEKKLTDCNQETIRIFNLSSKEEFLKNFYNLLPESQPDGSLSRERSEEYINQAFQDGYLRFECMHQTLDGEPIPAEVTLVRVRYKGNEIVAAYLRDLREQKRMLHEIEAAQFTTSAMFESNPQMNILFNSQFEVIDCNPAAITFMGFETKEEMLAGFIERISNGIPPIQPGGRISMSLQEWLAITVREGYVKFDTEIYINGKRKDLNVEFKKIPYENNFAIVAYVFDMTEIRDREVELANAHELNKVQLTKLNLVVQASKIGLWDMEVVKDDPVNPSNTFTWSDEFRSMLGYSNESDFPNILGSWSDRMHPDDKEKTLNAFAIHLLDTTGKTPYDVECRLLKSDGEYAYYHSSGETIRDDNGNPLRVAGSLVDITETKNILLDTERQRLEAEAANKAKSSFLSTMSHEIRTPMNAILGITDIYLQKENLDHDIKEAFDKIYTSGNLLLGIINDILDLSKIEAGKMELTIAKYELASLINDTVQLNMMRIGSKPIKFELFVNENIPSFLLGDELRVKQIINNLLSNAFKYTAAGTVRFSIHTETIDDNDNEISLIFSVGDTGQGMTKEQISVLFEEYSRFNLEANRTTEGTGLGMGITQNLIRMMNGEIIVDSLPERGSAFTVRLPQGKTDSEILGKETAENLCKFHVKSKTQIKREKIDRELMPYGSVLIVDDVEMNIYVSKRLMAPYELKIDTADSGFVAIEKIKSGNIYDIVFMDHMMPKMDGIEAVKIIRDMGYDNPIVALTANAVSGQADMFLENGFNDFISKPIDIRQLNAILNKLIRDMQPPEVIEAARNRAKAKDEQSPDDVPAVIDQNIAEIFTRDAMKVLSTLEAISEENDYSNSANLRTFIINVHGIKSALANIGKMDLSATALNLEKEGRAGNINFISSETPAFLKSLKAFVEEIMAQNNVSTDLTVDEDKPYLCEKLLAIKAACEDFDESTAEKLLEELRKKSWSKETGEMLGKIAEHLLHSDFSDIVDISGKFTETALKN
jgi:PAS domain S-box-containing protein